MSDAGQRAITAIPNTYVLEKKKQKQLTVLLVSQFTLIIPKYKK
jgi:hypothetical protein